MRKLIEDPPECILMSSLKLHGKPSAFSALFDAGGISSILGENDVTKSRGRSQVGVAASGELVGAEVATILRMKPLPGCGSLRVDVRVGLRPLPALPSNVLLAICKDKKPDLSQLVPISSKN